MYSSNVSEIIIICKRLPLTIDIMDENELKSLKIDTHNSLDLRFSSISDYQSINYYRLKSILSINEFHRLDTPGCSLPTGRIQLTSLTEFCSAVDERTRPLGELSLGFEYCLVYR